ADDRLALRFAEDDAAVLVLVDADADVVAARVVRIANRAAPRGAAGHSPSTRNLPWGEAAAAGPALPVSPPGPPRSPGGIRKSSGQAEDVPPPGEDGTPARRPAGARALPLRSRRGRIRRRRAPGWRRSGGFAPAARQRGRRRSPAGPRSRDPAKRS